MDVLLAIRMSYADCTRAEKRVADYVLAAPGEAMYQSITALAGLCKVGETSVLRFCRRIGCGGYQRMKLELAQAIAAQATAAAMPELLSTAIDQSYTALAQALEETRLHMDEDAIAQVIGWLCDAPHIHFFGVGDSMLTAMEAMVLFSHICPNAHMTPDLHHQLMQAALLGTGDVALLFSISGTTKDMLDIARRAADRDAICVAITRSAESPLGKLCRLALVSGGRENPLQGGSIAGKVAQMYIADVLYHQYFSATRDTATARRALTSSAVAERLL